MKNKTLGIICFFILLFIFPLLNSNLSSALKFSGKKIAIDIGHFPMHVTFDDFEGTYVEASNTIDLIENFTNIAEYDALLIPGARVEYSKTELNTLFSWFSNPDKLFWVAGDSDYAGLFKADQAINPLLDYFNSSLRLDSGAVADIESNDGTGYRVIATKPGNGSIGELINEGVERILLHGPTTIFGVQDGTQIDLRETTPSNVEILFSYNQSAEILDQDFSNLNSDFYKTIDEEGSYPAVAVETFNSSMLVVSGEVLFSNYKNMYGLEGEHGSAIHGKLFVDNFFNYFFKTRTANSSLFAALSSIILLSIVFVLFKKRKV